MTKMCVAAANYIIERTNEYNKDKKYCEQIFMTSKRLQKLLYFSEVEYMKRNDGEPMLNDEFQAWPSGPVIPSIYYKFVQYQDGNMRPLLGDYPDISEDEKVAIDYVLERTYNMDTLDLIEFSHINGGPWNHVYNPNDLDHGQTVPKHEMYSFYLERDLFVLE